MKNIDIVGGGVAGCGTALMLADKGFKINLYDQNPSLLSGSSDATPCRLGIFHYPDEETDIKCLETTIALVKQYPNFKVIDRKPDAPYLRKGHYFVAKDSHLDKGKVSNLFKKIQEKYRQAVQEDPSNAVFGPPEEFVESVNLEDYKDLIDISKVTAGFKTAECSLDWPRFKQELLKKVSTHRNIQVKTDIEVIEVQQSGKHSGFGLVIKDRKTNAVFTTEAQFVINASWQNIEALNQKAGHVMLPNTRTNRTKVMIEVELPETLYKAPSMFFCFGPFCSFTNLGEGRGYITYEPATNVESSQQLKITPYSKRLLEGKATLKEQEEFAYKIIEGVAKFIPSMSGAKFASAKFGNVRTLGDANIYSGTSAFNKRLEDGIEQQQLLWLSNASMKLTRFQENAQKVCTLVDKHIKTFEKVKEIVDVISESLEDPKVKHPKIISHMFIKHLQRHIGSNDLPTSEAVQLTKQQLVNTIKAKQHLVNTISATRKLDFK